MYFCGICRHKKKFLLKITSFSDYKFNIIFYFYKIYFTITIEKNYHFSISKYSSPSCYTTIPIVILRYGCHSATFIFKNFFIYLIQIGKGAGGQWYVRQESRAVLIIFFFISCNFYATRTMFASEWQLIDQLTVNRTFAIGRSHAMRSIRTAVKFEATLAVCKADRPRDTGPPMLIARRFYCGRALHEHVRSVGNLSD